MDNNPLIPLGELTKPATVLIEKISNAIGGIFRPYQIIRVAKAEAEADRIRAESQIEITDLCKRALRRFLEEEAKKQSNIESITEKAIPLLEEKSSPENMEDDWVANFFDKSRIVSDSDMQRLWSKVLAGEANAPGKFSRRTVNLLADLDKRDAELFARLCGFGWFVVDEIVPQVFDSQAAIYNKQMINFVALAHLETLGLIRFDSGGFHRLHLPKTVTASYFGRQALLTFPKDADNSLSAGAVLLTRAGQELAPICESKPVEGFFEYVCEQWKRQSLIP